jgi:RHS repeat-associated protein
VRDGGTNSATYTYVANSPLVSQLLFTNGSVQRMVTTKGWDLLNRLTNIVSATNGTALASFAYQYNSANQRTRRTDADGSYWVYTYDSLGQVTSGKKFWSDNTPISGMQFTYSFDDIGNRKTTGAGGDQTGGPLRNANYAANNLNQYGSRDVPGYVNVIGSAKTNATVSLWTPDGWWSPTLRHSDYYRGELAVNNSTGALWLTITNLAILGNGGSADITTNTVGNLFLPKNQEVFGYDLDGNLTSDGRWNYTWDAENRLTRMVANTTTGPQQRLDFEYDSKSRRIRKKVWNNTTGTGTPATDLTFVCDGWNLMGELSSSHSAARTYSWGLDLSGSMDGEGGIEGLLEVSDAANGMYLTTFDGNGNIASLQKVIDCGSAAGYEWGPFGEVIRATGPLALVNPFGFSTKFSDSETGLLNYGYRYYNPSAGRWLSRDPAGEEGGPNACEAFANSPINVRDPLGDLASNDNLDVSFKGKKIGYLHVSGYQRDPFEGHIDQSTHRVGAYLRIEPHIDDCDCGCCYKWRQHFSDMWDDSYMPAPDRSIPKWKYLPKNITEMKDILDIDYDKPAGSQWYEGKKDDPYSQFCSYAFQDTPRQPPIAQVFFDDSNPNRVKKVTVSFKLEFVRLSRCDLPGGGDSLLTIDWGFWYTGDSNGLLNH